MDCLERFYEDTTASQSYNDNIANSNEDTKHTTQESKFNKEHVKCNEKQMELDKMKKRCFDLLGNDETLIQSFLQFLPKPKKNRVS
jgi:predicted transcriptional regulator